MRLFFDVTKAAGSRQLSGLLRVSSQLRQALASTLGPQLVPVTWHSRKRCFLEAETGRAVRMSSRDYFLTPEVFSSRERKGFYDWLDLHGATTAAIFHDAIPWLHPDITWPKSVKRHPQYMKDLLKFDQVFCVSDASLRDLRAYWEKQEINEKPVLGLISWGADFFNRSVVNWTHNLSPKPSVLNIGILEPRKNQLLLLQAARRLWNEGCAFDLHFVGRVNPHFGKPIEKALRRAAGSGLPVFHHREQSDENLLRLYAGAHFSVFTSIAEGLGLPVIESLWLGIPCITRDLPSLKAFVDNHSCMAFRSEDSLVRRMRDWLLFPDRLAAASQALKGKEWPRWTGAAQTIIQWTKGKA